MQTVVRVPRVVATSRRALVGSLASVALFLLACAVARGGFFSSADPGDVGRYHDFVRDMQAGQLPYRDFYMEYPPGAVPAFLAPLALAWLAHYDLAFKFTVAVAGVLVVVALLVVLRRLGAPRANVLTAVVLVATAPASLGAVVLNRYDLWPTLILVVALAALLDGRPKLAFGLLALGSVVKLYPLVVLPVAAIHVFRSAGRSVLVGAVKAFVVVGAVCILPFALIAPGGLGYSVYTQAIRHLQLESLGASVLLALDSAGVYSAQIIPGKPGSLDLSGTLPNLLGVLTLLFFVAALTAIVRAQWRAEPTTEALVLACAGSVAAFVTFSKVISPQFLVWLVPLVPLVLKRVGIFGSALLFVILVATQIEVVYEHPLRAFEWPVWVLLARNVLLVVLFLVLLVQLRARAAPARSQ